MESVIYRFRYAVPSNGVPIYSESDFDDPALGVKTMEEAVENGQITDWEFWLITTVITEEKIAEGHV